MMMKMAVNAVHSCARAAMFAKIICVSKNTAAMIARIQRCFLAMMDVAVSRMRIVRKGRYASDIMEILAIMEMIDIYVRKSIAGLKIKLKIRHSIDGVEYEY